MSPSFQLIDTGWDNVLQEAATADRRELRVICPFIKLQTAMRLLAGKRPDIIQVITRFHLGDMCDGVSDTEALRLLLEAGARIRGVRNLHAKLYLFGDQRAIVTSANLTEAALLRNHEFGFVTSESGIITRCREYFDSLWRRAGSDLNLARLEDWEERIETVHVDGARRSTVNCLTDEGADAGLPLPETIQTSLAENAPQSFVKFFGDGNERTSWETTVLDEVRRTGCHWACSYPKKRRPRQLKDGAVVFMACLTKKPEDIVIYGRAIGLRHAAGRDEASPEDIAMRPWKQTWPIYVRVHNAEFVSGDLRNGVRLSELMDQLKSDSFLSTQRNARKDSGNMNPRHAYRQQAAVLLSNQVFVWLSDRLEKAFSKHGRLTPAELETLDWPKIALASGPPPAHLPEFREWGVKSGGIKYGTASGYAEFLKRCAMHYGETINEQALRTVSQVDGIVARVSKVVAERARWTEGTFNRKDVTANLIPALRAYGRFVQARSSIQALGQAPGWISLGRRRE